MKAQTFISPVVVMNNQEIKWVGNNLHRELNEVHVLSNDGVHLRIRLVKHQVFPTTMEITAFGDDDNLFDDKAPPQYRISVDEWLYREGDKNKFDKNLAKAIMDGEFINVIKENEYDELCRWMDEHPIGNIDTIKVKPNNLDDKSFTVTYYDDDEERCIINIHRMLMSYLCEYAWSLISPDIKAIIKEVITGIGKDDYAYMWSKNLLSTPFFNTLKDCMVSVVGNDSYKATLNEDKSKIVLDDPELEYAINVRDHTDSWFITMFHHVVGGDYVWYLTMDKELLEDIVKPESSAVKWLLDDIIKPLNGDLLQAK